MQQGTNSFKRYYSLNIVLLLDYPLKASGHFDQVLIVKSVIWKRGVISCEKKICL